MRNSTWNSMTVNDVTFVIWVEWNGLHALGDPARRKNSRRTSPIPTKATTPATMRQHNRTWGDKEGSAEPIDNRDLPQIAILVCSKLATNLT
ncbi:hypothetical protein AVEN_100515-1 [Araneus ventricosus]|uniref:Uncharacterized protein n=1 Tax=Araneus ventricosus TaxID=182803 RepID=A0A4Y2RI80_ARAVE|nr:hypothetical protein AVEN_100515-1 [Araneus ventricosus]